MRRLLFLVAVVLSSPTPAQAEPVVAGPVSDARLAVAADGAPVVAYASGRVLSVARRGGGVWPAATVGLPGADVELDGLCIDARGTVTVLARDRDGTWLALVTESAQGLRVRVIHPDTSAARIGPSGLALDRAGRPVLAYALWVPSEATYLRLVREDADGRLATGRITRGGFPSSHAPPAAAPVVLASGAIRVVETYVSAAIEWRPVPGDWQGQFLHGSALGVPTGRVGAAAHGSVVFAAWTEAYPTLGAPGVVLAVHAARTYNGLALEDALFAALAVTPHGAELAANRCVADGVCGALVAGSELDGVVADYAAEPAGGRQLLLAGTEGLGWYRSPSPLAVHVTLTASAGRLTGRVAGAAGGTVTLYRELGGGARTVVATVPVAADGAFAADDATAGPAAPAGYRAVWTDPATSIPYAALCPQAAA